MRHIEKNLSMILIVILGLAMIAFAIWFFERRIAKIEKRMKPAVSYTHHRHPEERIPIATSSINFLKKNRL
jgi:hypothetical protein